MKHYYINLIIFTCFSSFALAQVDLKNYKNFDSDHFEIGDKIILPTIKLVRFCNVLSDEGKDSLKIVFRFIKSHPKIKIELGEHSDSRGSDPFNFRCTESRILSIKPYLNNTLGADSTRVSYKGYGKTEILIKDEIINLIYKEIVREEMHEVNRRVELKIMSID